MSRKYEPSSEPLQGLEHAGNSPAECADAAVGQMWERLSSPLLFFDMDGTPPSQSFLAMDRICTRTIDGHIIFTRTIDGCDPHCLEGCRE